MKLKILHKKILKRLALGETNPEIAKFLKVSAPYIQNILCQLYQMTETRNKHHLVAWAYQNDVLPLDRSEE